ncbi:MAG: DNA double-strand break repair nuclease NurA [Nanoarchaeota archaeon]
MFQQISRKIREHLAAFPTQDQLIFNNKFIPVDPQNFQLIRPPPAFLPFTLPPTLAFLDGGQAEILNDGNFCLSFIRVAAQLFQGEKKKELIKNEFYLFTRAAWKEKELFYESSLFPLHPEKLMKKALMEEPLMKEADLTLSSYDSSLKIGKERAPPARVASLARRFAELALAAQVKADFILLDGTLEGTFTNEETYLSPLPENVSALAKTSSLFTIAGNNPLLLLNKIAPAGCWSYLLDDKTYFVKIHPQAKHVFRFEGNKEVLPFLVEQSKDAVFLGYPYGLIFVDKLARVSNAERDALRMNFLLRKENKEILDYLNSTNAHEILDRLG